MCVADILIEHEREDGQTSVEGRVTEEQVSIVDGDSHEEVDASEDGLNEGNNHTSVDDELTQGGTPLVGQTTMPDN